MSRWTVVQQGCPAAPNLRTLIQGPGHGHILLTGLPAETRARVAAVVLAALDPLEADRAEARAYLRGDRDEQLIRDSQLADVRAKLAALFALLDIEEETDEGRVFKPNQLGGSCRALDGEKINRLFAELKAFATSTP